MESNNSCPTPAQNNTPSTNNQFIDHLKCVVDSMAVDNDSTKEDRDKLWNAALEVYFDTLQHLSETSKDETSKDFLTEQLSLRGTSALALSTDWIDDIEELENVICEIAAIRKSYPALLEDRQTECEELKTKLTMAVQLKASNANPLRVSGVDDIHHAQLSCASELSTSKHLFPELISSLNKLQQYLPQFKATISNPIDRILFGSASPIRPPEDTSFEAALEVPESSSPGLRKRTKTQLAKKNSSAVVHSPRRSPRIMESKASSFTYGASRSRKRKTVEDTPTLVKRTPVKQSRTPLRKT